MKKLIDVSSYNGVVSWGKAKAYGCQGAILKISCGKCICRCLRFCQELYTVKNIAQISICYYCL